MQRSADDFRDRNGHVRLGLFLFLRTNVINRDKNCSGDDRAAVETENIFGKHGGSIESLVAGRPGRRPPRGFGKIDRPLDRDGIPVRFFDAVTRVPEGAAKLALRTGAGVVAAGIVRQGRRFVAHVSPLLDVEPSGDRTRDAQELTQQAMNWLESVIHQYPEQWFMFRNMWPREA